MKLLAVLLLVSCAFGQVANRVENGFVDAHAANWIPPTTSFASPPSSPRTGTVYLFTDALTPGAAVGGGTSLSYCRWSGSAWVAVGGAGGGASVGFENSFSPGSSIALACLTQSGGQFVANAALSGAVTITAITGCTLPANSSVAIRFQWTEGSTAYHVTYPSGWTSACDPYNAGPSVLVVQDGIWDGTTYTAGACTTTGTSVVPGPLVVQGTFTLTTSASPTSSAACTAGTIAWDANYIYVCTASGVWKRSPLTGGY